MRLCLATAIHNFIWLKITHMLFLPLQHNRPVCRPTTYERPYTLETCI